MKNKLPQQLKTLPAKPGVYLFKDSNETILYVGKAKSLRSRVRSYFSRAGETPGVKEKTPGVKEARAAPARNLDPAKRLMIPKITNIETITCDTETEALVLEANLIRKHQPPYNVILRDDKFYLFIKITTNEELPRIFPVRRINKDKARYFGPYSSAASVRNTLKLLRRIFPYRGEKESPREKIFPHPLFEPGEKSYQENVTNIIRFLQGHRQDITDTLKVGMKKAAAAKQYERAAIFRDQLRAIERLEGNQKVFFAHRESFDVISLSRSNNTSAANVFAIRQGKLLNKSTFLLRHRHATPPEDILRQFLLQYYRVAQDIPRVILIPIPLSDSQTIAKVINSEHPPLLAIPKRGKKRQLLTMGELNAQQLLHQEEAVFEGNKKAKEATRELAATLGLDTNLFRIETYDISNIQGTLATGSMVVFQDGQPDKSQYKKFRLKVDGQPNDYQMLQEILTRRFSNRHDTWPIPDLILIDGGKGQLSAAKKIIDARQLAIPLAALAKREEELFIPKRRAAIRLPYDSAALYLIQRMRDEAHRAATSYHRLLRRKRQQRSILNEVPGIGPKTKKWLLTRFGSLKAIRAASSKDLTKVIGQTKAKTLRDYL